MKKIILFLIIVVYALGLQAQSIYNDGARIISQPGTYWVVEGGNFTLTSTNANYPTAIDNLTIGNGATLSTAASTYLNVSGTLLNNGTFTGATSDILTLNGSAFQTIGGSGTFTFGNLTLNNTAGASLSGNIAVNGTLNFLNGILSTGSNIATIGALGSITNANASKYINGKLAYTFNGLATKLFPIGKGGNYRPLTFQYTALTGTSVVTAEQIESGLSGTLPTNTSLLTTNRSWTISQTGGSNLQYFVSLDATDYTPTLPVLMMKQYAGTILSYATTSPNYTNTVALTTLGNYGLGQEICLNPTNGGTIAANQTICSSVTPVQISSSTVASGQIGNLEYKWQSSIINNSSGFSDIANSNSTTYSPGSLTSTTWYKRLAIADCEVNWTAATESNVSKITVNPAPLPVITGSPNNFYDVPKGATYQYSTPANAGDLYSWSAPGLKGYCSANAKNCVNIQFEDPCGSYGQWTINVTETNPSTGCSATATKLIYITP